jgi:ferredoxin
MSTIITVDPIACQAYGYCAELLPELVSLDEWGYPVVDHGAIDPQHLELARRAAKDCPRRAFLLVREDEPSPA